MAMELVPTAIEPLPMAVAFTPTALGKDMPYSFRVVATTAEVSQPQIDWLVKTQGVKKVGALFPNDESGQAIAKDLEASYKAAGATMSAKEFFERERVDFVPMLTRMFARGIDAIELDGNSPATAGLIVKQARELGFKGKIMPSLMVFQAAGHPCLSFEPKEIESHKSKSKS